MMSPAIVDKLCSLQEKCATRSPVCLTAPNQSALESSEPGTSRSRDEVTTKFQDNFELFGAPATSNVTRTLPSGRSSTLGLMLSPPGAVLSSASPTSAFKGLWDNFYEKEEEMWTLEASCEHFKPSRDHFKVETYFSVL